jgi:predicted amidohydrolase
MFDEYRYFAPGDTLRVFETRFGLTGILICEDMWHPSTFFLLAHDGAQLILGPSAGPGRGVYRGSTLGSVQAWEHKIRSASQSYLTYVTHCNRVGFEDGVSFGGGSEVTDPFGTCLAKGKTLEEDLIFADLDKAEIQRARTLYPLLRDERLDLTRRELERIYKKRFEL